MWTVWCTHWTFFIQNAQVWSAEPQILEHRLTSDLIVVHCKKNFYFVNWFKKSFWLSKILYFFKMIHILGYVLLQSCSVCENTQFFNTNSFFLCFVFFILFCYFRFKYHVTIRVRHSCNSLYFESEYFFYFPVTLTHRDSSPNQAWRNRWKNREIGTRENRNYICFYILLESESDLEAVPPCCPSLMVGPP